MKFNGSLDFEAPSSTESSPLIPSSPYSASKAGADHLALSYNKTYNMNVIVTRSSNNYGPRQMPEKFIPKIIANSLEDKKIPLYGNGKNVRDWIYVEDNCRGIWSAATHGESGEIYHFASNIELENLSIIQIVLQQIGKSEELIEYVTDRPGHDLRYSLSTERTKGNLNWNVENNFELGIEKTIAWYKTHPDWIAKALESLKQK